MEPNKICLVVATKDRNRNQTKLVWFVGEVNNEPNKKRLVRFHVERVRVPNKKRLVSLQTKQKMFGPLTQKRGSRAYVKNH